MERRTLTGASPDPQVARTRVRTLSRMPAEQKGAYSPQPQPTASAAAVFTITYLSPHRHVTRRMDREELEARLAAEFGEVGLRTVSRQARDLAESGRVAEDLGFEVTVETVVSNLQDAPDGHTLAETLEQTEILSGVAPKRCYVDRGYQGAAIPDVQILRSGQKRGVNTRTLKRELKRRSAIEAVIGHMKTDGRMDRCRLKGRLGDAMNAVLAAAGHNIRLLLRAMAALLRRILGRLLCPIDPVAPDQFLEPGTRAAA